MKRARFIGILGSVLVGLALAGCTGLTPVYGDPQGISAARFNFAPPTNRTEQIILNRLSAVFPGAAGPNDPELSVRAFNSNVSAGMSNAVAVGRPVGVRVQATVTIRQDGKDVFTAVRFSDTTYQGGKLVPANLASAAGATETAAKSTADSLRAAILAGYRPGMVSTPPR